MLCALSFCLRSTMNPATQSTAVTATAAKARICPFIGIGLLVLIENYCRERPLCLSRQSSDRPCRAMIGIRMNASAIESALRGRLAPLMLAAALCASCAGAPRVLEPECDEPAPLQGSWDRRTPGYLIDLDPRIKTPPLAAAMLADRYGFVINTQYSSGTIFVEELPPETLAALRCASEVERVTYNAAGTIVLPP